MLCVIPKHKNSPLNVQKPTFVTLYNVVYIFGVGPLIVILFLFAFTPRNTSDSVVGVENWYGLDGPGIESWWERDILYACRPVLRPTRPPVQWVPFLFTGDKAAGACRWPPTPI
jgi:hypothetical protein